MKYYAFMPFWHWSEVMDERPTDGDYILGNKESYRLLLTDSSQ